MLLTISRSRKCRCKLAFVLGIIGYILSPLSWWNDAIVNIPIAIVVGTIFSLIDEKFFSLGFFLGYLASNIVGLILLQHSVEIALRRKVSLKKMLMSALIYTVVISIVLLEYEELPSS